VRSRLQNLSTFDPADANALYAEMRAEAEAIVRRGAPDAALEEERHAFMRYRGQGHEVMVPLPGGRYDTSHRERFAQAFASAYAALYSRTIPGVDIEVVSWALSLRAPADVAVEAPQAAEPYAPEPFGRRPVFDPGLGET